ncbi:MAG: hypothetical protein HUJ73_00715, partial [Eubacterium sp.]|nr:hypothetical protein [Eubacterium sp.]
AEEIRREFTANVSHELKTPLMSISGYAELIENGMARPEDIPGFAGRIHAESVRLKNLVEDIIRLSHMEEGGADMKKERIDLYDLCEEVTESLFSYAKERGVYLSFQGKKLYTEGSRKVLFEMVYNLCDNAVKYNRPGGRADLLLTTEAGRTQIIVRDTGIGIGDEHKDRVFERFYRVDKSHSKATGGTGLGLSIVKHAAMIHNAQITLESSAGQGTEFKVTFLEKQNNDETQ